ncbi:hypothetical protein GW17_00019267 [Ensete ventricosum]|nr:hypothetical protein GW17_00019267 [Ensete ventricosum]
MPATPQPRKSAGISSGRIKNMSALMRYLPDEDDDFAKWQKEVQEAEAAAVALKNGTMTSVLAEGGEGLQEGAGLGADDQPTTPPDGEEEFTDDDGSTYKWDRALRKWVPQVSALTLQFPHAINF